jgi:hypothetical protein
MRYLELETHDAVLVTFNPSAIPSLRQQLSIPVRSLPPSFFRYPASQAIKNPNLCLLHVGSLGDYHPQRRDLVLTLQRRKRIPFLHTTTNTPEEAAQLYSQYALILNIPLNNDLNHRFFEIMASGVPQIVFAHPKLVGEHTELAKRADIFWVSSLQDLEDRVENLFSKPNLLHSIHVEAPVYLPIKQLLKKTFTPIF